METMTEKATVTLPAATFDALKAEAEKAGGVGYGYYGVYPACLGRYARVLDGTYKELGKIDYTKQQDGLHTQALIDALGEYFGTCNDEAVKDINDRKGAPLLGPVTFDEIVEELGLVRGS